MTTPQNPGEGDTPQDPTDPQNPYGTPPPPPPPPPSAPPPSDPAVPAPPPPAPVDPAPVDPAPAAPGAPTTPIPAAPVAPVPASPPPYGDPSVPAGPPMSPMPPSYGQPVQTGMPGQPGYAGYTSYPQPGVTGPAEPGKGMAIAALIIGILGCTVIGFLVAIPLAIVVLVRSRGGQNHGKGLAIAAIVVSVISLGISVVGGIALGVYVKGLTDVNDLAPGDCITAHGLTDDGSDTIDTIRTVNCTDRHDGEVLATTAVTADLAKDFSQMDPQATCAPAIEAAGKTALVTDDINVTALTVPKPRKGDNIACVAYRTDGKSLTSKLGS